MSVRGIFAKADICNDKKLREALLDEADTGNDGTFWIIGSGTESILHIWLEGYAKKYDGSETFPDEGFEVGDDFIYAAAILIWERGDRGVFIVIVCYEQRVDKHRLQSVSYKSYVQEELAYLGQLPLRLP